ncbi:sigma-54-dependent Fis family transcriptional regulator [bacterium]|nr:sigma-54-dependent Fis family transcriptional regulator [bacterium]
MLRDELRNQFRNRYLEIAKWTFRAMGEELPHDDWSEFVLELDKLLATAALTPLTFFDSDSERGLVKKTFPAGLPGIEDYRSLPETPRVLTERAAQNAGLVGQSKPLIEIVTRALLLADTHARVLISGESGTGKELLARMIHHNSPRRRGPFIVVNCGALEGNLAISELFGHEPHAFTGADPRGRQGKTEAADGGTLFLDEVAELPSVAQAALLRFLDSGEVQKIGRIQPRRADVRIISASHTDLTARIQEGRFREDLYYRLFVAQLHMPALRDRMEDLLPLCLHILNRLCIEYGRTQPRLVSNTALEKLAQLEWKGNIRQLAHQLEYAFINHSVAELEPEHFPILKTHITPTVSLDSSPLSDALRNLDHLSSSEIRGWATTLTQHGREWFSSSQIAHSLAISVSGSRAKLRHLTQQGIVEAEGEQKGRRYRLAERFVLDFPSQSSHIKGLGELGE